MDIQKNAEKKHKCIFCGCFMKEKNSIKYWNGEAAKDDFELKWICIECDRILMKLY